MSSDSHKVRESYLRGEFETCLQIADQLLLDDPPPSVDLDVVLFYKALSLIKLGRYDDSMQIIQVSEDRFTSDFGRARGLIAESYGLYMIDEIEKAERYMEKALQILTNGDFSNESDFDFLMSLLYNNLGNLVSLRDLNESNRLHEQALGYRIRSDDLLGIGASKANIGNNYNNLGKIDTALDYYIEALDVFKAIDRLDYCAGIMNNIGNTLKKMGELEEAINYFNEALDLYRELPRKDDIAMALHNLGNVYHLMGDYNTALTYTMEAYELRKELNAEYALTHSYFEILHIMTNKPNPETKLISRFFTEFQDLVERTDQSWIHDRYKLIRAIWFKNQEGILEKAKALELVDSILDDNQLNDHELHIIAMVIKCELLLMELKLTNDSNKLEEVKELTLELNSIGEKHNLHRLSVESFILEAKLELLLDNVNLAVDLLETAYRYASDFKLGVLKRRIEMEQNEISRTIQKWSETLSNKPDLDKKMDDLGVLRPKSKLNHFLISPNRLAIILVLVKKEGSTFQEIKEITKFSSTKLSKQLSRLIENGYVYTKPVFIETKPSKLYFLTPETMSEVDAHREYIENYADLPIFLRNYIHFN